MQVISKTHFHLKFHIYALVCFSQLHVIRHQT